jgi:HNH endonuclease
MTMKCIFCTNERPPSLEHVFPLAIGGHVTTDRVCKECNSTLGSRVDAALCEFLPIRIRRAELNLAGNSRTPPGLFDLLTGDVTLVNEPGGRLRTTYNEITKKLEHKRLYQASDVVTPEGQKLRRIIIDPTDKDQIPTILKRERKRHNLPPLSNEELAIEAANYTINTIKNPTVKVDIRVKSAYLRHAMFKIAYELAFLWLGETYLDDPLAFEMRAAICEPDIASTNNLAGWVGYAPACVPFTKFWTPDKANHLAYANVVANQICVAVRVFDIYAACVTVSREANRYLREPADFDKLRFLAINSVAGKSSDTAFADERQRLAINMTTSRRLPPFSDPLTIETVTSRV